MDQNARLDALLSARYGTEVSALDETADTVLTTLLAHRSVRQYASESLPSGTLERLIAAAQSTATSSNLQTWSVIALEETAHKSEAATLCGDQEFIRQAPLFLVFCADLARLTAVSDKTQLSGEGLDYLEMFVMAIIDAALAAQNAAIAAEAQGLGICYVGGARNHPRELAALLELPPRVIALFGMAVGVPADDRAVVKPRLPQSAVLHYETYNAANSDDAIERYDEIMQAFYIAQQMKSPGTWSRRSAERVALAESLSGRHVLREILQERGFGLK